MAGLWVPNHIIWISPIRKLKLIVQHLIPLKNRENYLNPLRYQSVLINIFRVTLSHTTRPPYSEIILLTFALLPRQCDSTIIGYLTFLSITYMINKSITTDLKNIKDYFNITCFCICVFFCRRRGTRSGTLGTETLGLLNTGFISS